MFDLTYSCVACWFLLLFQTESETVKMMVSIFQFIFLLTVHTNYYVLLLA